MTRTVVITGAAGFIGGALARSLRREGWDVRPVVRAAKDDDPEGALALGDLASVDESAVASALAGTDAVLHFAGLAHRRPGLQDEDAAYRAANVVATERLMRAAIRAHVPRFVLASTVKVSGESTSEGQPFTPADPPQPEEPYARSKRDAETALIDATRSTSTTPIVLRLPLTYGHGAKGNFARLVAAVAAGHALPLASIANRRSRLSLRNLEGAIVAILAAASPPAGIHFVADADSVSTPELVRAIANALGRPARLYAMPVPFLRLAGALMGRRGEVARLADSLEVDTSSLAASTSWRPASFAIEARDVAVRL